MERLLQILNRMADALAALLLAACFLLGVCSLFDVYQVYRKAEDTSFLEYKPVIQDDSSVVPAARVPDDYVAWLSIDRTAVDYPVMQGADNFEYLNKAPGGEYALSGSIFLDAGNSADFSDPYSLIYGHHMRNGSMFGQLEKYKTQAYYNANQTFHLYTPQGNYVLEVVASVYTNVKEGFYFNYYTEENYRRAVADYKTRSLINTGITPVWGEKLVILYTCSYQETDGRFLVVCRVAS